MSSSTVRHAYLDWVRGVAVLIMIEAHVLDAWTQAGDRSRPLFGYAIILGGFGAPLFLFLAGLAAVLSAESKLRKTGDFAASWRAVQNRGWQIFGLAFLFRLQSYVLSGGYSLSSLLKVDILNIMGPAIAVAALTGRLARKWVVQARAFRGGSHCRVAGDPAHPGDAGSRAAAGPNRVVFPAYRRANEFHPFPVDRIRFRRCCGWRRHSPGLDERTSAFR